ncbi:MAG: transporter substrate-binding domain-containing protein [Desulfovibrionaceae bacterium]
MRPWIIGFLATLALSLANLPAMAQNITVGCAKNAAPMDFELDGAVAGFDVDLWKAMADKMGLDYTLKPMDFDHLIPALRNGELDAAIGALSITSQREKIVDFSQPYFESGLIIAVRTDNESIKTIKDLRGKATATVEGSTSAQLLDSLNRSYGAGNAGSYGSGRIKLYPGLEQTLDAVRYGRAEAALLDLPMVLYYIRTKSEGTLKVVGPVYRPHFYGFAFPLGSTLRKQASIALLELMEGGEYNKIFRKWFGDMMLTPH